MMSTGLGVQSGVAIPLLVICQTVHQGWANVQLCALDLGKKEAGRRSRSVAD